VDPVTHGLAGAAVALAVVRGERARPAALCSGLAALSADLDVLLVMPADPLFTLEAHRHATHALPMAPLFALLATGALWWWARRHMSLRQLYGVCLLGLSTAGLLDTCTSYGTRLWWPLSAEPVAWNLVSVFDPLFTVGLLVGVLWTFRRTDPRGARWGLAWLLLYLSLASVQQGRAADVARDLAAARGHSATAWVIKPTMGNTLLWSARYLTTDSLFAVGVRLPPGAARRYDGDGAARLHWRDEYASLAGSKLFADIGRFDRLSDGWLVRHPDHTDVIGDGRYAMLPTALQPLWGIHIDATRADEHVPFDSYRDASSEVRSRYIQMLLGRDLAP
jgi:inner membrane protein